MSSRGSLSYRSYRSYRSRREVFRASALFACATVFSYACNGSAPSSTDDDDAPPYTPDARDGGAGATDGGGGGGDSAAPEEEVDPGPPAVQFIGRFNRRDPAGPTCGWPGCRIRARFEGTGVTVRLKERYESWMEGAPSEWDVAVDGVWQKRIVTNKTGAPTDHPIATGLANKPHVVELYKRSEAQNGATQFIGFDFAGGPLLSPPARKARRIEVIGDSAAAGFGIEGVGKGPDCPGIDWGANYQNFRKSLGARLGEFLGADVAGTVYSGKGIFKNLWRDDTETLPVLYALANPLDPASAWDFSYVPDVVVVMAGGNDFRDWPTRRRPGHDARSIHERVPRVRRHAPREISGGAPLPHRLTVDERRRAEGAQDTDEHHRRSERHRREAECQRRRARPRVRAERRARERAHRVQRSRQFAVSRSRRQRDRGRNPKRSAGDGRGDRARRARPEAPSWNGQCTARRMATRMATPHELRRVARARAAFGRGPAVPAMINGTRDAPRQCMASRIETLSYEKLPLGERDTVAASAIKTNPMLSHAPATRTEGNAGASSPPLAESLGDSGVEDSQVKSIREMTTVPECPAPIFVPTPARQSYPSQPSAATAGQRPAPIALTSLVIGIGSAAATWAGLAMLMVALVYPMSTTAHVLLLIAGTWITAAGTAYALTTRPEATA